MREEQIVPERIVARRNRGVGREDALRGNRLESGRPRKPEREMLAQEIENEEGGVALIEMRDGGRESERAQRAAPGDAENHLLPDARRFVAAVQAVRDIAVGGRILGTVGVEQVHGHAAGLRFPQSRNHLAPGDPHTHLEPLAARRSYRLDGQVPGTTLGVLGMLHAVVVDRLSEVALPVKQSHGDEADVIVARGLAVIAGEHAEAAGVDRETLAEAVLCAEIRNERLRRRARSRADISIECRQDLGVAAEVDRVRGRVVELRL